MVEDRSGSSNTPRPSEVSLHTLFLQGIYTRYTHESCGKTGRRGVVFPWRVVWEVFEAEGPEIFICLHFSFEMDPVDPEKFRHLDFRSEISHPQRTRQI